MCLERFTRRFVIKKSKDPNLCDQGWPSIALGGRKDENPRNLSKVLVVASLRNFTLRQTRGPPFQIFHDSWSIHRYVPGTGWTWYTPTLSSASRSTSSRPVADDWFPQSHDFDPVLHLRIPTGRIPFSGKSTKLQIYRELKYCDVDERGRTNRSETMTDEPVSLSGTSRGSEIQRECGSQSVTPSPNSTGHSSQRRESFRSQIQK